MVNLRTQSSGDSKQISEEKRLLSGKKVDEVKNEV